MKSKLKLLVSIIFITIMMTGCAMFESVIPEMSEDDKDKVVEYAAQSLLKFDKKHGDKVTDIPDDHYIQVDEPVQEVVEIQPEDQVENPIDNLDKNPVEDVSTVTDNSADPEEVVSAYSTVGEAVHIPDAFKIELVGLDVDSAYPKSTDAFFVINATKGTKLLILKFDVTNLSDTENVLDMSDKDLRFRVRIDGNQHNMLTTLLTNDLSFYKDTVGAGETIELVLIAEINTEDLENMSKVELVIKDKDETSVFDVK